MLVIGVPTYNESENISNLVKKIDIAASELNINIIIINADNKSPDGTAEIFKNTHTRCKKISLINNKTGKGHNVFSIIQEACKLESIKGCVLIDGDILSFSRKWLENYYKAILNGYDYIIPVYSRSFQEGNTTNHFAYPLVLSHTCGNAPHQVIAGDFGISAKLLNYFNT
jgi:glycosyltransferase involved in cell wall biosynthesis